MYDKEALKRGIYEKYANVNKEDDFYNLKIGFEENIKSDIPKKIGNVAAILIIGGLIGTVRICCISKNY